jgi:hypothetical protein
MIAAEKALRKLNVVMSEFKAKIADVGERNVDVYFPEIKRAFDRARREWHDALRATGRLGKDYA